jgi:CheY-like chemotaxis protein
MHDGRGMDAHMGRLALVVDDSMVVRHAVGRFLEQRGFVVESAANAVEALERLNELHPELIVTDLQMPHMSGWEFIAQLRKRPDTAQVPVIVLTGVDSDTYLEEYPHIVHKDIQIEAELSRVLAQFSETQAVAG